MSHLLSLATLRYVLFAFYLEFPKVIRLLLQTFIFLIEITFCAAQFVHRFTYFVSALPPSPWATPEIRITSKFLKKQKQQN